jgi:transcriptional regulator with XRE-family HTH domain
LPKNIIKTYKELFQVQGSEALTLATEYVLNQKKAKNLADIAKKVGISASLLTAYMHGTKKISDSFIEKFNMVFNVDLNSPITYSELPPWFDEFFLLAKEGLYKDVPAEVFLRLFASFRQFIMDQQQVIENLRQTNTKLNRMIQVLFDYSFKNEDKIVSDILGKKKVRQTT